MSESVRIFYDMPFSDSAFKSKSFTQLAFLFLARIIMMPERNVYTES